MLLKPWLLQVSASSPSCRLTDPKGVVSGKLLRANAAGPRRCDGCTFWQADLGPRHRLMCNYYTMRHDTSPNYPRSWALQVKMRRQTWRKPKVSFERLHCSPRRS